MEQSSKQCGRCGKDKPLSDFIPRRGDKAKLRAYCEHCCQVAREGLKRRYENNPEFREGVKTRVRQWAAANPIRNRKRARKWQIEHPEQRRVQGRRYYARNVAGISERRRIWYQENPGLHADESRKSKYGVTAAEFDAMVERQHGKCAICTQPFPATPHLDHDHLNGALRDLLCDLCNRGLGYFLDNPVLLREAASYLERHRALVSDGDMV